jgi:pimeloyl-ACP methyl ester carboxylesterase
MTYGIRERHDIISWVRRIRAEQPSVRHIVGVGVSLGGTVLLQGAAAGADLSAVVADSVGADLSTPYKHVADHTGMSEALAMRLLAPVVEPLFLNASLRYGLDLSAAAPVAAVSTVTIPVLLIHGTQDAFIPIGHARRRKAANARYTTLWEIPGAQHTRTDEIAGMRYEERVLSFLAAKVGNT